MLKQDLFGTGACCSIDQCVSVGVVQLDFVYVVVLRCHCDTCQPSSDGTSAKCTATTVHLTSACISRNQSLYIGCLHCEVWTVVSRRRTHSQSFTEPKVRSTFVGADADRVSRLVTDSWATVRVVMAHQTTVPATNSYISGPRATNALHHQPQSKTSTEHIYSA